MNTEAATVTNLPTPIERAARALAAAKNIEEVARDARLKAEADLLALLPSTAEGTITEVAGDLKVSVRYSINRTVDQAKLSEIAPKVPEAIGKRLFRWKADIEMREMRFLQNNEPDMYALVAQAITAKPAKPSISVEQVG